jgi:hypothetical protein
VDWEELKLSNGLASGGDIKLDMGGRRFILASLASPNSVIDSGGSSVRASPTNAR